LAKRNWTKEQLEAICCDAPDILVSAGAGSGKTSVLTERIIQRLCDDSRPADITRMLIVTFTNAATEELRLRVAEALRERLAAEPENRRLRRQLLLLPSAHIYTISSFCLGIVRANLSALGLPAGLRVCDEAESDLLAAEIMERVIDDFYEGICPCPTDFGEFCDAFVSDRDSRLAPMLMGLYKKLREYVAGVELLRQNAESLRSAASGGTDFMATAWGRSIAEELRAKLGYYVAVFERALEMFGGDEKLKKAYYAQFAEDLEFARALDSMLAGGAGYAEMREFIGGYKSSRLGQLRGYEKTPELELFRGARKEFSGGTSAKPVRETKPGGSDEFVKGIYHKYFSIEPGMLREVLAACALQCETLYSVLRVFEDRFMAEKRHRAIADFNDLERYAYRLLYDGNGNISDLASAVAADFDEIYIDEYQDTNELEDKVFAALAKAPAPGGDGARTRFMVGDVKQSIYAFRGAEPSLFAAYRSDPAVKTLFLRANFRSDRPIIEFANRVSEYIFTGTGSEVDYGEGDKLVLGKTTETKDIPVRVVLFDSSKGEDTGAADDGDDEEGIEVGVPVDGAEGEQEYGEPEFVADEIKRLVDSGEYRPDQIAILLRSTESRAEAYERALRSRGIGSTGGAEDFFERPEVLAMVCLLFAVNNPTRDIYLAGALRSPFFGFTLDDLVRIRRLLPPGGDELPFYFGGEDGEDTAGAAPATDGKALSLYEALVHYTKTTGFEKGKRFLEKLATYRKYAEANPADRVVRFIFRDIGAIAFAAGGGDPGEVMARRRSLLWLYDLARTFEHGQFRGLGSFAEYLEGLIETASTQPPADATAPGVRIMSIHKSKGLEFPVVFLCDCARRFNMQDYQKAAVLYDPRLGAAAKLGDSTGFGSIDTPVRSATALRIARRIRHEEMRALYVALTRARERLYVTATVKEPEKLLDEARANASILPAGARAAKVMGANNFISWIAGAFGGCDNEHAKIEIVEAAFAKAPAAEPDLEPQAETEEARGEIDINEVERYKELFLQRLAFSYRYKALEKVPAKLSVSDLYPSILDEGEGEGALEIRELSVDDALAITGAGMPDQPEVQKFKPPRFLSEEPETATAAERGSATHIFMQFCDFDFVEQYGIKAELERLVARKFMTPAHAELVDVRAVRRFFGSRLYREMRTAKRLFREVRFNVRLPASEFTEDEKLKRLLFGEQVLVQGVIDCYYELPDGRLRLVDYKTDYIPKELRGDVRAAEKMLAERHARQLGYYARALEKLACRKVDRKILYSFSLGRAIYLD